MSNTTSQLQSELELRSRIDKIATRLVVAGTDASLEQDLKELSSSAAQGGFTETSTLAARLVESTRFGPNGAASDQEDYLRKGFTSLQQTLESEAKKVSTRETVPSTARPPANSLAQDPELVNDFVTESREHLSSIEGQMLVLEQNPDATEVIHSVFRAFHTIKGVAGFLEFGNIQKVAHEVETLLDLARNSKLSINADIVDVVLQSADYLMQAIDDVETSISGLPKVTPEPGDLLVRIQKASSGTDILRASPDICKPVPPELPKSSDIAAKPDAPVHVSPAPLASSSSGQHQPRKTAENFSVRVETAKLDYLMDMVGEMVIAQSLIRHNPVLVSSPSPRLLADLSQLSRLTAEVQRTTMGMRMIPIGQLFQRTARMVRDLSRKTGKLVDLQTTGEDTEVDKNIAEELSDPLLHMVRNSLDHGIELPEEREAAGKTPTARITLAAYHQGGQIIIKISDDGRGLDRLKILKKAQQQGLVQEGVQLSDADIFHLIFEPGFSTAEKVTDISGRGVGMDVVRKNVQKLRGRIDIQSAPGVGTTFLLNLPLTLAIIDGLVVAVGNQRYIVPISDVKEILRPTPGIVSSVQERDEMALVRGRLLPIVRLNRRFNVKARSENICEGLLVVAECDGKQFCLLVDDLLGKQEVVIKSLGEALKNIKGIAGCAILGDGRVGLILDLNGVYRDKRQ